VTLAKAKKESSRLGYGYGCEEREKGQSNERDRGGRRSVVFVM
jgi:hypothetical protein